MQRAHRLALVVIVAAAAGAAGWWSVKLVTWSSLRPAPRAAPAGGGSHAAPRPAPRPRTRAAEPESAAAAAKAPNGTISFRLVAPPGMKPDTMWMSVDSGGVRG